MRAIWATSSTAIVASAFVGVLLGAYLHELQLNERNTGQTPAPATTVRTEISTVIVTVTGTATAPRNQEAGPRAPVVRTSTHRQVADVTSDERQGPVATSPPPAPTTTSPAGCRPLSPFPPPGCDDSTQDEGRDPS